MSFAFSANFRESSLETEVNGNIVLLQCSMLEFADKIVISLSRNGEIDVTYDIPTPSFSDLKTPIRRYHFEEEDGELRDEELNNTVTPKLLIGNASLKTQVVASQIGLLLSTLNTKNIILNISGKLFGIVQEESYNKTDFDIVQQVLALVKSTYLKKNDS